MGRYTGPSCRLCRRAGEKLFLKGDRCFTPRCAVERRHSPPGNQNNRRRRPSDYGVHLREKQKARQIYGVMEGQFRRYMSEAFSSPGISGFNLLRTLERRLDNIVYLLGFADSRKQARQMVRHGHITVKGVKTDIPSFLGQGRRYHWLEGNIQEQRLLQGAYRRHTQAPHPLLAVAGRKRNGRRGCGSPFGRRPDPDH